jgi:hypothetical protein
MTRRLTSFPMLQQEHCDLHKDKYSYLTQIYSWFNPIYVPKTYLIQIHFERFQVLAMASMNLRIFWDVQLCS